MDRVLLWSKVGLQFWNIFDNRCYLESFFDLFNENKTILSTDKNIPIFSVPDLLASLLLVQLFFNLPILLSPMFIASYNFIYLTIVCFQISITYTKPVILCFPDV